MKPSAISILGLFLAISGAVWLLLVVTADHTAGDTRVGDATGNETAVAVEPDVAVEADSAAVETDVAVQADVVVTSLTAAPQFLDASDLETGSSEFSAVAFNGEGNRLLIADDQDRLYEFEIGADGVPMLPARRVIELRFGAGDTEAIAWMYGSTFVIGSENSGELAVVELDDTATEVGPADVIETVATGIAEIDGSGLEGVAYLGENGPARFVVVSEKPPRLLFVGPGGEALQSFPLAYGIADASDVAVAPDGSITVLSDESRRVSTLVIDDDAESVKVSREGSLEFDSGAFPQPEGLVWSPDGGRLYIVGESPGPGRYSFGVFTQER